MVAWRVLSHLLTKGSATAEVSAPEDTPTSSAGAWELVSAAANAAAADWCVPERPPRKNLTKYFKSFTFFSRLCGIGESLLKVCRVPPRAPPSSPAPAIASEGQGGRPKR